jgi:SEC-C motif-containing protein
LTVPAPAADCPCGRCAAAKGKLLPLAYAQCCGRFVEHWATPEPDAEHLMRSRYSAFVLERADYLLATWHASTRPAALDFEPGARWLGLEVKQHASGPAPHEAIVRFVARYRVGGQAVRLAETSRFVCEVAHGTGRWFYVDGEQT